MKVRIMLLLVAGSFCSAQAQTIDREVVGTQGNSNKTTTVTLSWTAGEAMAGLMKGQSLFINQGFQQGELKIDATAVNDLRRQLKIVFFPNPAGDLLHLDREAAVLNSFLTVSIFTMEGRRLNIGKEWPAGEARTTIDLRGLPAGSYLLHLWDKEAKAAATVPFQKGGLR